jgi:mannose/cellobiose epimerase-like protein (N-acyl-D-glucosamine 2-epimerase family)
MHLTEALMAASEATNDSTYPPMAERIVDLIIGRHAAVNGWRVTKPFNNTWSVKNGIVELGISSPHALLIAITAVG